MIKAALYTRVSTKKQNTDRQVAELQAYAQRQGFEVVLTICETVSGSTKKADRPGLEQVLDLARRGEITEVVSLELSRLGRNAMDVRQIIVDLIDLGVCTHIVNRNLRSLDGKRRKDSIVMMLLGVLADLAEMEKELLVERINSGLEEARRKNKTLGRPQGSTLAPEQLLEKYPGVAKDLREGISLRRTAAFREVSLYTVQRVKKAMGVLLLLPFLICCSENKHQELKIRSIDVPKGRYFKICLDKQVNNLYFKSVFHTKSGKEIRKEGVFAAREAQNCFEEQKMQLRSGAYNDLETKFYEDSLENSNLRDVTVQVFESKEMDEGDLITETVIEVNLERKEQAQ